MTTANAARPEDQGDASARTTDCPHDGPVPHRVLIVDDDRAIRESLARALELHPGLRDLTAPGNRFDVIWTFTKAPDGWHFAQLPELVLPQDQAGVIGN